MQNSKLQVSLSLLCLTLFLLTIDYFTYLSIYPLYILPVIILARKNRIAAWFSVPLFAFLSSAVEDHARINLLSTNIVYIFLFRSIALYFISFLVLSYSSSVDRARKRYDRLKQLLPVCPDCGAIYCSDHTWRSLDALLENPHYLNPPTHIACSSRQASVANHIDLQ